MSNVGQYDVLRRGVVKRGDLKNDVVADGVMDDTVAEDTTTEDNGVENDVVEEKVDRSFSDDAGMVQVPSPQSNGMVHPRREIDGRIRQWPWMVSAIAVLPILGICLYVLKQAMEPVPPPPVGPAYAAALDANVPPVEPDPEFEPQPGVPLIVDYLAQHPIEEAEHPLKPLLEVSSLTLDRMRAEVRDYTATIVKRERVNNRLGGEQKLTVKIRQATDIERLDSGFAVYLRFTDPGSVRGREVIWAAGKNDGKLVAHEGGWKNLTTVRLVPTGRLAMIGNRYPITEIGIEKLLTKLLEIGGRIRVAGSCRVAVDHQATVDDRPCSEIEITQISRRPGQEFYRAEIYIDHQSGLPICYRAYDWPEEEGGPPVLLEEYAYHNLRINVGLTDIDFDEGNPDYDYP